MLKIITMKIYSTLTPGGGIRPDVNVCFWRSPGNYRVTFKTRIFAPPNNTKNLNGGQMIKIRRKTLPSFLVDSKKYLKNVLNLTLFIIVCGGALSIFFFALKQSFGIYHTSYGGYFYYGFFNLVLNNTQKLGWVYFLYFCHMAYYICCWCFWWYF